MKRRKRKICRLSMKSLKRLFAMFGLAFSVSDHANTPGYKVLAVKSATGGTAECLGWDRWDMNERLSFVLREQDMSDPGMMDFVAKSVAKSLSEKRALAWTTKETVTFPFGKKTVTVAHEVDLPDFSSLAELELKVAASGGYMA